MISNGHSILFTVKEKEFEIELLNKLNFNYHSLGRHFHSKTGKIWGLIKFNICLLLLMLKFKPDIHPKGVLLAVLTGLLGFAGALCFLYAALKGPISLVAVLSALSPIITVLLAMFFLNETITIKQGLGIVLGLGAVVLIAT